MTKNDMSFEEALKKLEETVKAMESGDLGLDELLSKFETGIGLLRQCEGKLAEAEGKIEVLTKNAAAAEKKAVKKKVQKEKTVAETEVVEDEIPLPEEPGLF